jgi:hypothetical protein
MYTGFFVKVSELFLFCLQQFEEKHRIYALRPGHFSKKSGIYALGQRFSRHFWHFWGIYALGIFLNIA